MFEQLPKTKYFLQQWTPWIWSEVSEKIPIKSIHFCPKSDPLCRLSDIHQGNKHFVQSIKGYQGIVKGYIFYLVTCFHHSHYPLYSLIAIGQQI